jgi:hypothetical protein
MWHIDCHTTRPHAARNVKARQAIQASNLLILTLSADPSLHPEEIHATQNIFTPIPTTRRPHPTTTNKPSQLTAPTPTPRE